MRPSPTRNTRAAAIPFAHTLPKAHMHLGVLSSRCTRCIQVRQEIGLCEHVRARV